MVSRANGQVLGECQINSNVKTYYFVSFGEL